MKSVRERMDILSAYREVGTYRAAAEICGTTAKTVKRVVLADEAVRDCQSPMLLAELTSRWSHATGGRHATASTRSPAVAEKNRDPDRTPRPARRAAGMVPGAMHDPSSGGDAMKGGTIYLTHHAIPRRLWAWRN